MKILIVSTMGGTAWGGSEVLWYRITRKLLREGHQVCASVFNWGKSPAVLAGLEEDGLEVHLRPDKRGSKALGQFFSNVARRLFEARSLRHSYQRFQPDVVLFSNGSCFDLSIPVYANFANRLGVPYVVYVSLNTEHETLPYDKMIALRRSLQVASWVLFSSNRNLATAQRQIAGKIANAMIISNPPTCDSYPEYPWPQEEPAQLAMVARLDAKVKGQPIVMEVLASESWKNRNWHLNLFGKGPDERYLKDLAQYYGLENKVTWHGYVEDIGREIWAKNHLLLMPSLYEGCPISLYDAALFRRPAVVSDVGGNAEFVMEGENGFVSAAPTAVDFGRALERAWASRFQWKQMGEAARNRAIDHVDAEPELKVCEILENLTANACR